MSNATQAAPAEAPVFTPAPAPAYLVPSPVGTVASPDVAETVNFSWIGVVGLLAAFLVIAIIALVCLWYKKRAYKQALKDQREFFAAKRRSSNLSADPEPDWLTCQEEESEERSKRGQLILADYENLALGSSHTTSTRFSEDLESASSGKLSGVLEQEIPGYSRDKRVVRENHHVNVLRNKFSWNLGENLVDEVFHKGEEGSAQMGVRYSRTEIENLEIFTQVGAAKKKRSESESASLLRGLYTIAVESPPTGKWTLRTFSLPLYRHSFSPSSSRAHHPDVAGQHARTPSKTDSGSDSPHQVKGSANSLPTSPAHSFSPDSAYGTKRLTKASSWTPKPSRLGSRSNVAQMQNSAFITPPTPPPPPLPLPGTTEESRTSQEWPKVDEEVESHSSIANFAPVASTLTPTLTPSQVHASVSSPPPPPPPPPPPFPTLPCRRVPQPPSPPPFASALGRNLSTLPSPLCSEDGIQGFQAKATSTPSSPCSAVNGTQGFRVQATTPPSPSPSPPCSDAGVPEYHNTITPPPSPPPLPARSTPPASPLPGSRPLLAPLILPGRPDLGDSRSAQDFRPKRHHKTRPLHWEKLKPESRLTMVWDTIRDSMELDEDMIENLFGVTTRSDSDSEIAKRASNLGVSALEKTNKILDPKKAHNIAIQLRARGLAKAAVCDALLDGDGLDQENLELLVKMAPTDEELTRFHEYKGELTLLGPADRFIQGILQIPSAFERLHALLFKASYWEELHQIQEMIVTLEMACKELKGSRTFLKLLEAVLKTGNRLNTGTFRGDAKAFKLDTLLKLADVKGVDGKTTLLHFVIQEIMKAEGARAARLANVSTVSDATTSSTPTSTRSSLCTTPSSTSSPLSHFATSMETHFDRNFIATAPTSDDFRKAGMGVVCGIPTELLHVRKAGAIDLVALRQAVCKLQTGLQDVHATLRKLQCHEQSHDEGTTIHDDDVFTQKMSAFVGDAEAQVGEVDADLELVLANVKAVSVYFYGETDAAKSTQPALKVFVVMREFLSMLEQACKDVTMKGSCGNGAAAVDVASSPRSLRPAAL